MLLSPMVRSRVRPAVERLPGLDSRAARLWGKLPVKVSHTLHESTLFSDDALAQLIDRVPRKNYDLLTMAPQGSEHLAGWREGHNPGLPGHVALQLVKEGRMWLNLRRIQEVSPDHSELLESLFDEIAAKVPGFSPYKLNLTVLISSPTAQVYYHADVPGQSLWQVRGRKRVYVYPNHAPFLPEDQIEGVVMGYTEAEIDYEPWFDDHARVEELGPGDMMHWPLNCPHRVENLGGLSVSVTTEHWTNQIRNTYAARYANGVLRSRLGMQPPPPVTRGLSFWPRAALAAAVKASGVLKPFRHDKRIEWELDPSAPSGQRAVSPWVLEP